MRTDIDVAVIGGGLAGLSAARTLAAAGRSPVVFEATAQVGGRQRSARLGGQVLELGAVFFGDNYPMLASVLAHTGLRDERKRYDVGTLAAFPVGDHTGTTRSAVARSSHLTWADRARLATFAVRAARHTTAARDSLGGDVPSALAARLDAQCAGAYLRRHVGDRFVEWMASPFAEALAFEPVERWSALGALQVLAFADMSTLWGLPGGNDRCARAIAEPLDVRLGHELVSVDPGPESVALELTVSAQPLDPTSGAVETGAQRLSPRPSMLELHARDVVLAAPAPSVGPLLRGTLAELVGQFRYSASIVLAAAVDDLAVELPAVSIFGGPGEGRIRGLVAERDDPHGKVLAYGALAYPWQYELWDEPDDALTSILVDLLERGHGGRVAVSEARVVRWRHSIPIPTPGVVGLRTETVRSVASLPHVELAGDWLVSPSQEGGLRSGRDAARRLLGA